MSLPDSIKIGKGVLVRAVRARGPRAKQQDGRHYWRAVQGQGRDRDTIWTGWATPAEAEVAVLEAMRRPRSSRRSESDDDTEHVQSVHSMGDLITVWLGALDDRADAGRITEKTVRGWSDRAKYVKNELGTVPLRCLGAADVENYVNARMKAGAAPSTVKREVKALLAAWSWGQKLELVPARPLPSLRDLAIPDRPTRNKHTPSAEDIGKVLAKLDGWPHLAVLLLTATGARIGEIATLTWDRVELGDTPSVTVLGKRKPGRDPEPRKIYVAPEVGEVLERSRPPHATGEDLVLGAPQSVVRSHLSAKHLAPACKAAKVQRFTPHGLRRAASNRMRRAGVEMATYANVLGHSIGVAAKHYTEITDEDRRVALERAQLSALPVPSEQPKPEAASPPVTSLEPDAQEPSRAQLWVQRRKAKVLWA